MKEIVKILQVFRDQVRRQLGIWLFDYDKNLTFDLKDAKSILFLRNDAKLGDAIVSSGAIRKIRRQRPDVKIIVLTTPSMKHLFKTHFGVDQVVTINKRPSYKAIRSACQEIGEVDVVVSFDLNMKMRELYMLKQIQSKANLGLESDIGLININISKEVEGLHFSDKFNHITQLLGLSNQPENYIVPQELESQKKIGGFLKSQKINQFALLNPFGSGRSRKLNNESILKAIQSVKCTHPQMSIVILTAPSDSKLLKEMGIFEENVHHFDISTSIYDATALVVKSTFVISVDTSIVHIATGLNRPQVALYNYDEVNFTHWNPNSKLAKTIINYHGINSFSKENLVEKINEQGWIV